MWFKHLLLITTFFAFSCMSNLPLKTVKNVDINKYLGEWYEIARLPNTFEKNLDCVTATYLSLPKGEIKVINKGYVIGKHPKFKTVNGKAWIPNKEELGKLKVQFFWPFSGDYWIIALDENYNWALVGDPSRKYLWILARTKQIPENLYQSILKTAKEKNFPVETIIRVNQNM